MSKERLNLRLPQNIREDIEEFEEARGIDNTSEATRQVIRRGLDDTGAPTPGERLLETATGVAGVAAVGALFFRPTIAPVFGLTAFVLALLWAAIMVYAGRDLV